MAEHAPIYLTARNMRIYVADGWMQPCSGLVSIISHRSDFVWEHASQAAQEVVNLWPELKEDKITAADLYVLAHALSRSNVKIHLEWRLLRCFLVNWKYQLPSVNRFSNAELADLATSVRDMTMRQIGPCIPLKASLRNTEMVTMVRIHKEMVVRVLDMMQKREVSQNQEVVSLVLGHCKDLWGKFKRATDTGLKDGIQKTFEAIIRFVTIQAICRRVRYCLENLRDILEDLEEDLTVCLYNDGDMEKRVLCDLEEDLDNWDRELYRYHPEPKSPQAGGNYAPTNVSQHSDADTDIEKLFESRRSTTLQPTKRRKTCHSEATKLLKKGSSSRPTQQSSGIRKEKSSTVRVYDQDQGDRSRPSDVFGREELKGVHLALTGMAKKSRTQAAILASPSITNSDVLLYDDDEDDEMQVYTLK